MRGGLVLGTFVLASLACAAGEPSFCSLRCGSGSCADENWPKELVACRGIPVVCGRAKSLGELPDVNAIPASLGGSRWQAKGENETIVMQAAAGPRLMEFARRADEASGGKTPILFTRPVMAWTMPRVREDGELCTVAIVNCSIDVQDPVAVRLRGVCTDAKVSWVPLHGARTTLEARREGCDVVVTLPSLGAWDCGYLLFGDCCSPFCVAAAFSEGAVWF